METMEFLGKKEIEDNQDLMDVEDHKDLLDQLDLRVTLDLLDLRNARFDGQKRNGWSSW